MTEFEFQPPDDLNALNGLNELNKERSDLGGFDAVP